MTRINELPEGFSKIMVTKVQDPYSMRCGPHVHGIAYDLLH